MVDLYRCIWCKAYNRGNDTKKFSNEIHDLQSERKDVKTLTYRSCNIEAVWHITRFMELGQRDLEVMMPCFELLYEQRKLAASAVKLVQLQYIHGGVERTTWDGRKRCNRLTDVASATG